VITISGRRNLHRRQTQRGAAKDVGPLADFALSGRSETAERVIFLRNRCSWLRSGSDAARWRPETRQD
jgi:hypothetical protein